MKFNLRIEDLEVRSCNINLLSDGEHNRAEIVEWSKGRDKKETYPLPNALSFLGWGPHLWLDNELAGELEKLGLAKSFKVIIKWKEKTKCK